MSCHLRPGVRVREQEVSTSADVSRTTVRKAFEILIYEGLLERSDSQHLHVAGLDFKDDRNLRDFRIMIEPTAADMPLRDESRKIWRQCWLGSISRGRRAIQRPSSTPTCPSTQPW